METGVSYEDLQICRLSSLFRKRGKSHNNYASLNTQRCIHFFSALLTPSCSMGSEESLSPAVSLHIEDQLKHSLIYTCKSTFCTRANGGANDTNITIIPPMHFSQQIHVYLYQWLSSYLCMTLYMRLFSENALYRASLVPDDNGVAMDVQCRLQHIPRRSG